MSSLYKCWHYKHLIKGLSHSIFICFFKRDLIKICQFMIIMRSVTEAIALEMRNIRCREMREQLISGKQKY